MLAKIDSAFFVFTDDPKDWDVIKNKIEEFLKLNGINEELDIDVEGIHLKNTNSIIAAIFQLFSIVAVFAENEWKKAI